MNNLLRIILILLFSQACNVQKNTNTASNQIEKMTFTEVADQNVVLPPEWAFGILYGSYANQEQSIELINQIIQHDYPIDAFWTDSWIWDWQNKGKGPQKYIDFIGDTISFPNRKLFWTDFLQSHHIKSGMWVWDCIQQTGNESVYEDFAQKNYFKNTYINTDSWHNGSKTTIIGDRDEQMKGTWNGNIDFDNPEAVAYFKQKMKPFFDEGLDFIKLDRTDAIPVCKAMFEMTQEMGLETKGRGFILSHSGGVNQESFKNFPGKWTDDTRSTWSATDSNLNFSPWLPVVGLKENIAMYTDLNKHYYKIPFLANDMGGFALSTNQYLDEELYIRWLQFSMFVPLTTPFSQPENPSGNIPFLVSNRADAVFKKYAQQRAKLFPYIYSYAHRSRLEGINTIRPIEPYLYQYLFGNELLVVPVYESKAKEVEVFLPPESNWYNFDTGVKFKGGQTIVYPTSLDEIPVFAREGAIIPMRKYYSSIEKGNNEKLELHVFVGDNSQFVLIEDDGTSNAYLNGTYAQTLIIQHVNGRNINIQIHPIIGLFDGINPYRTWEIIIHGAESINHLKQNGKVLNYIKDGSLFKFEPVSLDTSKTLTFSFIY